MLLFEMYFAICGKPKFCPIFSVIDTVTHGVQHAPPAFKYLVHPKISQNPTVGINTFSVQLQSFTAWTFARPQPLLVAGAKLQIC